MEGRDKTNTGRGAWGLGLSGHNSELRVRVFKNINFGEKLNPSHAWLRAMGPDMCPPTSSGRSISALS